MTSLPVNIVLPGTIQYPDYRLSLFFKSLPVLSTLGNFDLLGVPLTALFCSRKCPGDSILKAYDLARELREKETPIISGFHTPVEKDMLEILLKGKGPIVICPARRLEGMRIAPALRKGVNQGRLLFCSIAPLQEKRVISKLTFQRNLLVSALASEYRFLHVEKGGNLETLEKQISSMQTP